MNAFEELHLPLTASAEEIKAAYHSLVKQYHPDRFQDKEAAAQAQEKLIRLNLAYEEAMKSASDRPDLRMLPPEQAKAAARRMLSQGRYEMALRQLVRSRQPDAEYYYIEGQILMHLRQFSTAHAAFRKAVDLQPDSREYRLAAFEAARAYKKHAQPVWRVIDWVGGVFRPRKLE